MAGLEPRFDGSLRLLIAQTLVARLGQATGHRIER
jgi:hypothetical protein